MNISPDKDFYPRFEGIANYLLKNSDAQENVNPSSFLEDLPGLLRNFKKMQFSGEVGKDKIQIIRSAGLTQTKTKMADSTELFSLQVLEGLATMSDALSQLNPIPEKFVITSLLSNNTSQPIKAESLSTSILNNLISMQSQLDKTHQLTAEHIISALPSSIQGLKEYARTDNGLFLINVLLENLAQFKEKPNHPVQFEMKYQNIGLNVYDTVTPANRDTHHAESIESMIKEIIGFKSQTPLILNDDPVKNTDEILYKLLIKEHLKDTFGSQDTISSRYFYAALLQYVMAKKGYACLFHCESGKDRTSVVAAIIQKISTMTEDELLQLLNDPSYKIKFLEEVQRDMIRLDSDTQNIMSATESKMLGIKAGSFSQIIASKLLSLFRLPELALFLGSFINIFQFFPLFLKLGGNASFFNVFNKTGRSHIARKIYIDSELTGSGEYLLERFAYSRFLFNDIFLVFHQMTVRIKNVRDFRSAFACLFALATLSIQSLFSSAKFIISATLIFAETPAFLLGFLAKKLSSRNNILLRLTYNILAVSASLIHGVLSIINQIFTSDLYQQAGLMSYKNSLNYLEAVASADLGRRNRDKITTELLKKSQEPSKKDYFEKEQEALLSRYTVQSSEPGLIEQPSSKILAKPVTAIISSSHAQSAQELFDVLKNRLPIASDTSQSAFESITMEGKSLNIAVKTDGISDPKAIAVKVQDSQIETKINHTDHIISHPQAIKSLLETVTSTLQKADDQDIVLSASIKMNIKTEKDRDAFMRLYDNMGLMKVGYIDLSAVTIYSEKNKMGMADALVFSKEKKSDKKALANELLTKYRLTTIPAPANPST
ncbi:hypothetical protein EBQ91_06650 [bacterium]|nr:hypothetical protein [bacterium]